MLPSSGADPVWIRLSKSLIPDDDDDIRAKP
jgi:hypothetical protein